MVNMPKDCTRELHSEKHGKLKMKIGWAEDGGPAVTFSFPTVVGDMDISFDYKKTDEGLAAAIKMFSGLTVGDLDSVISQAKQEFGIGKLFEVAE